MRYTNFKVCLELETIREMYHIVTNIIMNFQAFFRYLILSGLRVRPKKSVYAAKKRKKKCQFEDLNLGLRTQTCKSYHCATTQIMLPLRIQFIYPHSNVIYFHAFLPMWQRLVDRLLGAILFSHVATPGENEEHTSDAFFIQN